MKFRTLRLPGLLQCLLHACLVALAIVRSVPLANANGLTDCINHKVTFDGIVPLHYATVKARSGPRLYLHARYPEDCTSGSETSCPARAYLVPGNGVAIGKQCGGWDYVQYIVRLSSWAWACRTMVARENAS